MLTIFAIHGNGGGGFRFDRIRPYMADDVHLITPTLPGFADAPADPTLQTMGDWAAHIHALVLAEAGPVVLLGTGIGGAFLLEYVQHYPADGLILHAPVGTRLDSRRFPWLMSLPGARAFGQWLFSARTTRPIFKQLLFVDPDAIPADYINRFFDEYRQCTVFGQMFDLITADWYQTLRPADVPTALLWGEKERVLSTDHVQDYQQLFPDNTVEIVPGWDHFPMIEQPAEYAATISTLAKTLTTGEKATQ